MSTVSDDQYAERLLEILENDRKRLRSEPGHAAVVLWMVEEVREAAARLSLNRERSKAMLLAASQAKRAALDSRRTHRSVGKTRAA